MQVYYKDYELLEESGYIPDREGRVDPGNWAKNIKGQNIYVTTYDGEADGLKMYFYDGQSHVSLRLGRREGEAIQELEARLFGAAKLLGFREEGGLK